ncbi:MAG: isochorismatase family protein [Polyangiales bacterium]
MRSALIVVDVQESFRQRPYWSTEDLPEFTASLQAVIDRAEVAKVPIVQVFHVESTGPFSLESGYVRTLSELRLQPSEVFHKSVHSALFGSNRLGQSVDYWLRSRGVERLVVTGIRTEQCCETTTRHASDLGYKVSYALDATLTFPMTTSAGRRVSSAEIRERTELVLAGRFAEVVPGKAISF